jgi:hypothetical protein
VLFRLLSIGEDRVLFKKAEAIKEAYNQEISDYNTMKLKTQIVSIEGNTDRSYIDMHKINGNKVESFWRVPKCT